MPRAGLTTAIVVAEAARLADEVGLERLTLAMLAQRLGVALPSLYKHIRGPDALLQTTRTLRSALHGFVSLENMGGFGLPQDVDRSFDRLVTTVDTAFRAWPREGQPGPSDGQPRAGGRQPGPSEEETGRATRRSARGR